MIAPSQLFSTDPGNITDFTNVRPADIFNNAVLPKLTSLESLLGDDPAGLDEAAQRRESQAQVDEQRSLFNAQQDDAFLASLRQKQQAVTDEDIGVDYNAPVAAPQTQARPQLAPAGDFVPGKIKLANYGYASDSSPDYNSNILKIGHANNKLEDGVSAALTKSLAKRLGLKTGDYFEAQTADGKILRRRYDDTVPTTYKGRRLPETVDLYEVGGSNKFGGTVVGIRPLKRATKKLDLPEGDGNITATVLPPKN
jgi:hypothetical protein